MKLGPLKNLLLKNLEDLESTETVSHGPLESLGTVNKDLAEVLGNLYPVGVLGNRDPGEVLENLAILVTIEILNQESMNLQDILMLTKNPEDLDLKIVTVDLDHPCQDLETLGPGLGPEHLQGLETIKIDLDLEIEDLDPEK